MVIRLKVNRNKANNQLAIMISRKKLNLKKEDNPNFIDIGKIKMRFLNGKKEKR